MRIALVCTDRQVVFADPRRCPSRLRGMAEAFLRAGHDVHVMAAGPQAAVEGLTVREVRLPVTSREVDWHFAQVTPDLVIERYVPGRVEGVEAAAEARLPLLLDVAPEHLTGEHDEDLLRTLVLAGTPSALGGALVSSEQDAARLRVLAGPLLAVNVVEDAVRPAGFDAPAATLAAQVATRLRLYDGEMRIAYLGPLTRESGVLDLLRAVAGLGHDPLPRVVLIGDGAARNEALALSFEHGLKLTLCGRVAEDELAAHLNACACVVTGEGAGPLPLLQAMAAARAVVCADTPEHRRIARGGDDARLVAPGDVQAIHDALAELLAAPEAAARMGARAREHVRASFTWEAQSERLLAFGLGLGERERAV
ncbi:MAG: glycosyltransferase family 4 protein [Candidatus Eisenbacteria bacterium]|uniref:Glycosyltransferase family 4 protein n=1 Tax=Eiseniibacteriota bacterium TaxID=2212470 RepID=A0A933SC90_UNCEI|nr:glycosyltransferase family 4 protein [Candidatus Eisenbacteria bacterium]